jgi:1-acyl-sn-glycerol-3-phosphate acyltransferase
MTTTEPAWPQAAIANYLRWYHRHEVHVDATLPDRPVLIVSNHGFGGLVDLNVLAMTNVQKRAGNSRPTTALVHQLAWTMGLGRAVEAIGGRPASREAAMEAFAAGHNVLVFPGGDIDAGKSWRDRNHIRFDNRCGFARLAIEHEVPIVPVVTAGAGESLFVLSDGQRLAAALGLPRSLRVKTLPISVSIPWGLSIGGAGMLPYSPLPTKLITAVLPAFTPGSDDSADELAARVEAAMQARLGELVSDRLPLVG